MKSFRVSLLDIQPIIYYRYTPRSSFFTGLRHRRARYLIYNDSSVRPPRRYIRRPQAIITAGHRETPVVIGFGR